MSDNIAEQIRKRLHGLGDEWKKREDKIHQKRKRLDERLADESELNNEIELLEFW